MYVARKMLRSVLVGSVQIVADEEKAAPLCKTRNTILRAMDVRDGEHARIRMAIRYQTRLMGTDRHDAVGRQDVHGFHAVVIVRLPEIFGVSAQFGGAPVSYSVQVDRVVDQCSLRRIKPDFFPA